MGSSNHRKFSLEYSHSCRAKFNYHTLDCFRAHVNISWNSALEWPFSCIVQSAHRSHVLLIDTSAIFIKTSDRVDKFTSTYLLLHMFISVSHLVFETAHFSHCTHRTENQIYCKYLLPNSRWLWLWISNLCIGCHANETIDLELVNWWAHINPQ